MSPGAWAALGLGAATAWFYPEILFPDRVLADYDVWTYFYPLRAYAVSALREGRFPLWTPDIFLGAPFFANPQTSVLYPGAALFLLFGVPYGYSLSVVLHVFLTAGLTYAFGRLVLGLGRAGSLVAAAGFAFGGAVSAQVGHINQLSATPWMVLAALAADRAYRGRHWGWAAAGAAGIGLQLLAGHAQVTFMTAWVVGLLLAWRVASARWAGGGAGAIPPGPAAAMAGPGSSVSPTQPAGPRLVRAAAVFGTVFLPGAALAGIQLLPTWELARESIRGGGLTYAEAIAFSLPPPLVGRALLPGYWANVFSEYLGYIGVGPLLLAGIGLAAGRGAPTAWATTVAALGLLLALGGSNPAFPLLYHLPGFDLFRVPARWLLVYSLGAAALAGLGADWLLARPRPAPARWRLLATVGLATAAAAGFAAAGERPPGRILGLWLLGVMAMGALALWTLRARARAAPVLLAAAVLVDLRAAAMTLPARFPVPAEAYESQRLLPAALVSSADGRLLSLSPTEYELADAAALDARYPDLAPEARFNFKTALKLDEVMSPNVPLRYGLRTADGYDGGVLPLRRYLDLATLLVPAERLRADGVLRTRLEAIPDPPTLDLFGVRTIIANQVTDVHLAGVAFDTATARSLPPGGSVRVELDPPATASQLAVLGSLTEPPPPASTGRVVVQRADGSRQEITLAGGAELFWAGQPGPIHAARPRFGPGRPTVNDSLTRVRLGEGPPITALEWQWSGPGRWELRGATLLGEGERQRPLLLQPDLELTPFPPLKLYRRVAPARATIPLVAEARVVEDAVALAELRADPASAGRVVRLAPSPDAERQALASRSASAPAAEFQPLGGPPERLTFVRAAGSGGGYLVVPDAWMPGWRAWVDGEEVAVERANVLFKAVWVPPQGQRVELAYQPASLAVGALVSAAGLLAVGALGLAGWRRPR